MDIRITVKSPGRLLGPGAVHFPHYGTQILVTASHLQKIQRIPSNPDREALYKFASSHHNDRAALHISNRDHQLRFAKRMEPSQGGPGLEAPSPASPASQGKRKIEFKLTPGKKLKSKDEPRMITLGQYKERHKKGCYMTVDLSGTAFPTQRRISPRWVRFSGMGSLSKRALVAPPAASAAG